MKVKTYAVSGMKCTNCKAKVENALKAIEGVSIAMGKGTDVAMDVAQVTLMGDDLNALVEAVEAAALMAMSSVSVVLNSLRLKLGK